MATTPVSTEKLHLANYLQKPGEVKVIQQPVCNIGNTRNSRRRQAMSVSGDERHGGRRRSRHLDIVGPGGAAGRRGSSPLLADDSHARTNGESSSAGVVRVWRAVGCAGMRRRGDQSGELGAAAGVVSRFLASSSRGSSSCCMNSYKAFRSGWRKRRPAM